MHDGLLKMRVAIPGSRKNASYIFTPKFGKENMRTRSFQDCVMKESIA